MTWIASSKKTVSIMESKSRIGSATSIGKELKLVPLFVARMMPKTYINEVYQAGGFSLILKYQLYPFGTADFANEVREELQLPTGCPSRLENGTLQRLVNFHFKKLQRLKSRW
ncbi:MAG: hypothetical protein ABI383_01085 [Acidobacteriaceae bacterium]